MLLQHGYRLRECLAEGWHILSIDCTKVEQVEAENMYQRSELDYLIYNDPAAYVELIVEGDPKRYLQAVTRYELPEEMK